MNLYLIKSRLYKPFYITANSFAEAEKLFYDKYEKGTILSIHCKSREIEE